MTMDEVRQAIGEPPRVFRKAKDSACTTDSFYNCVHARRRGNDSSSEEPQRVTKMERQ
jgi:hypothetical protein